jgi:hypothetical protein
MRRSKSSEEKEDRGPKMPHLRLLGQISDHPRGLPTSAQDFLLDFPQAVLTAGGEHHVSPGSRQSLGDPPPDAPARAGD